MDGVILEDVTIKGASTSLTALFATSFVCAAAPTARRLTLFWQAELAAVPRALIAKPPRLPHWVGLSETLRRWTDPPFSPIFITG
jgi:hypothetical protein